VWDLNCELVQLGDKGGAKRRRWSKEGEGGR